MALDVTSIHTSQQASFDQSKQARAPLDKDRVALAVESLPTDIRAAIGDLQRVSEAFNRRLSFSLNEKLGQVVVKVIDNDTDKVVSEIPPTELQHVYERIREVIGLLFDKSA
jgi:uncharacterized FlaG/YvyC family protein